LRSAYICNLSDSIRILKSGHENSARAVQSHRWRLRRECRSHPGLGRGKPQQRGADLAVFLPSFACAVIHLRIFWSVPAFLDRNMDELKALCRQNPSGEPGRLRRACEAGRRGKSVANKAALLLRRGESSLSRARCCCRPTMYSDESRYFQPADKQVGLQLQGRKNLASPFARMCGNDPKLLADALVRARPRWWNLASREPASC